MQRFFALRIKNAGSIQAHVKRHSAIRTIQRKLQPHFSGIQGINGCASRRWLII